MTTPKRSLVKADSMFDGATSFQGLGLSKWHLSELSSATGMFMDATSFDANLSNWVPRDGLEASDIFKGATSFQGDGLSNKWEEYHCWTHDELGQEHDWQEDVYDSLDNPGDTVTCKAVGKKWPPPIINPSRRIVRRTDTDRITNGHCP